MSSTLWKTSRKSIAVVQLEESLSLSVTLQKNRAVINGSSLTWPHREKKQRKRRLNDHTNWRFGHKDRTPYWHIERTLSRLWCSANTCRRQNQQNKRRKIWITIKYAKYTNSDYKKHIKRFSMATKKIFKLQKKRDFGSFRKERNFLIEWHFILHNEREREEKNLQESRWNGKRFK